MSQNLKKKNKKIRDLEQLLKEIIFSELNVIKFSRKHHVKEHKAIEDKKRVLYKDWPRQVLIHHMPGFPPSS